LIDNNECLFCGLQAFQIELENKNILYSIVIDIIN